MFRRIRNTIFEFLSNGGAVLVVVAVLFLGIGEAAQPVTHIIDFGGSVAREPAANPGPELTPTPGVGTYITQGADCPDSTWERSRGASADVGSSYTTCDKNNVFITYFDRVPAGVNSAQAQDRGVYPFKNLDSVEEAIQLANSR